MKVLTRSVRELHLNCFKQHLVWRRSCCTHRYEHTIQVCNNSYPTDSWTNVTPKVLSLIGRNLYLTPGNPIYLISEGIRKFFVDYDIYKFECPVVSVYDNFDSLLIGKEHVSRDKSQTYYVNENLVLRSHTSAHQSHCLARDSTSFACIADVYRRDEIDSRHHAVFHQSELLRLYHPNCHHFTSRGVKKVFESDDSMRTEYKQKNHSLSAVQVIESLLKSTAEMYVKHLLGRDIPMRWVDAYFPFTHPSWELEILNDNNWIEILGSGVVEHELLENTGHSDQIGWALGFGLERLAMLRYSIPDIRLFWTKDTGFLNQFETATPDQQITYKPISSHPQCYNDISFWLPESGEWTPNDFFDIIRSIGGDMVEFVKLIDVWKNKSGNVSNCYRISYRSNERPLTQTEVNQMHNLIEITATQKLNIKIR